MVSQNELRPASGSKHRRRRLGRGHGSGRGTTAGRGTKGQKSRSGGNIPPYFEGGQLPLVKRMPSKRGFTNIFKTQYAIVNVGRLGLFPSGAEVTPVALVEKGLVKSSGLPIKLLGEGEVGVPLTVKAHKFSATARAKIEAAGGKAEEIA